MTAEDPKFKKGDLVYVEGEKNLLSKGNLGIVITEPMLMFIYESKLDPNKKQNYWVYDVVVGDQLIKELPEQILKGLKK
mgnify:FL=1